MSKIKIGIIGAGPIAEEYIKIFSKNTLTNVIGIVGRRKKNSKILSLKYNIGFYGNKISELLIHDIDIIIVAVDILNTINVAKQISNFSGLVLIEKPLGVNHEETKKILKILNSNKHNCFVALNRRFYDNILFVKKILKKDKSKKIISVVDQENTIKAKAIGHKKKVLQNWMFANSIHLIDLIIYFADSQISKISTIKKQINKEKIILSNLYFKNNTTAVYNSIWNRPGPWSLTISTSNYYFNFSPIEILEYRKLNTNRKKIYKNITNNYKPGFKNMVNALLRYYKVKKKNKNITKHKSMLNYLLNIDDYINLSKIIKKIYF